MKILGELLGYNQFGNDILGSNRDPQHNCVVCGMCAMTHSPEQSAECARKLFGGAQKPGPGE